MLRKPILWIAVLIAIALSGIWSHAQDPGEVPYEFKNQKGEIVQAFRGTFAVPENRKAADSRTISLTYVRFPSTNPNPGHPIVYLAGGPGGSGIATAKGRRFPLFMALRQVADVIAFDQRGTGGSSPLPLCQNPNRFPIDQVISIENGLPIMKANAAACAKFWADQGFDLAGYNTRESAADLEALRLVLGADKLNLWGISYGSHLAFAALKQMDDRIHRVVLASSEGLNHTVKLPGWSDAFFHRVQLAIHADPVARQKYPHFLETMRRVLDRLEKEPKVVTLPGKEPEHPIKLTLSKSVIQLFTSFGFIKNPSNITQLVAVYSAMDAGEFRPIASGIFQALFVQPNVDRGMSAAMDAASGVTQARMARFELEAENALIGKMLNFPYPFLFDAYGKLDLGDDFRQECRTATPTLFLNGTLDGRTFPEETWEIMRGFDNGIQIIVENAGHDLFMSSPEVGDAVVRFLQNGAVKKTLIHTPPPTFH